MTNQNQTFQAVMTDPKILKHHPRNYQQHPELQLRHIIKSIETHGFYRNVVTAKDNTILAGHGVIEAALRMGITQVPVIKMDIDADDPRALKLLTGDNEIGNLAVVNDRMLTELLKEVMGTENLDLTGTGFDADQLSNLLMVTRPAKEIQSKNEAAEWLGMPDWELEPAALRLIVSFANEEDRQEFAKKLGYDFTTKTKSVWYPDRGRDDTSSIEFVD
jgi:ParB-like chromosome segregation protein Spo0J